MGWLILLLFAGAAAAGASSSSSGDKKPLDKDQKKTDATKQPLDAEKQTEQTQKQGDTSSTEPTVKVPSKFTDLDVDKTAKLVKASPIKVASQWSGINSLPEPWRTRANYAIGDLIYAALSDSGSPVTMSGKLPSADNLYRLASEIKKNASSMGFGADPNKAIDELLAAGRLVERNTGTKSSWGWFNTASGSGSY